MIKSIIMKSLTILALVLITVAFGSSGSSKAPQFLKQKRAYKSGYKYKTFWFPQTVSAFFISAIF